MLFCFPLLKMIENYDVTRKYQKDEMNMMKRDCGKLKGDVMK